MLEKYINTENRKNSFSTREIYYLSLIIAIGALIRLFFQYDSPFVNDEIWTLLFIKQSPTFLLTHFTGGLTMNHFILLEKGLLKVAGGNQMALIIVPEFAGIAAIPLTAILAKMFASKKTALVSATLIAFNPFLISYSGTIRSYSLLTALSLSTIILFFRWYANRTFKNGILVGLSSYLMMISHLNGTYTLAYIFALTGLEFLFILVKREKDFLLTLIIPMSLAMALTLISYANLVPSIAEAGIPWHDTPPTSISYIPYIFAVYFGNGFYGWVSALLMGWAVFLTIRAKNNPLLLLLTLIVLSIALISIQGLSHFPWGYARFLIFLVPVAIIFIAEGMLLLSAVIPAKNSTVITFFVILLVLTWVPGSIEEYKLKLDQPWGHVAAYIKYSGAGNMILVSDGPSALHLPHYFDNTAYKLFNLKKYSKVDHLQAADKIFFVITGLNIQTPYPVVAFGDIQVVIYPKTNYQEQMKIIQYDLEKRISGRDVSPEFTSVYQNLRFLNKILQNDPALDFDYYDLYMRCFQLTERQRNIPLALQAWELENARYNVIR